MPSKILLTVDIGNTAVSFATFSLTKKKQKPKPKKIWVLPTNQLIKRNSLPAYLRSHYAIVSNVVPSLEPKVRRLLKKTVLRRPLFVSHQTSLEIKVRTLRPSEVGADRIVNARGGRALTKSPFIVVDFGTATTFDCVDAQGSYRGGVIAPGPAISAEALHKRTAQLPLVFLEKPVKILGRNTLQCIQSGLYYGYRGLVFEIIRNLRIKMGKSVKVLATGGLSRWITKGLSGIDQTIPHLTHLGLYHFWWDQSN